MFDKIGKQRKRNLIRLCTFLIVLSLLVIFNSTCSAVSQKKSTYNELSKDTDSLSIKEGILSRTAQVIKYKRNGKKCAIIELSEPVKIVQAEKHEEWGYYQFPSIGRSDDGTLVVSWEMAEDTYKSYGKGPERHVSPMMSKDEGVTWEPQDKYYRLYKRGYNVIFPNGDELRVATPAAKNIHTYDKFPKEIGTQDNYTFFPLDSLPEELQGVYLNYVRKDNKSKTFHARLIDPGSLRYSIDDMMPVVWWGNIKQQSDSSLIAGMYPTYYLDDNGVVLPSSITFYRSDDKGKSWTITGKIPFRSDGIAEVRGDGRYEEPAFEILKDSTFLCVMRTGYFSPMYRSFSYDHGKTWSQPEPFTSNGVMPKLFLLKNGVLVLLSGRPGIQIRFCFDGTGKTWSDPIDMIPFVQPDGSIRKHVSCGYASFIEAGDDTFYLVYSDFTTKNLMGKERKSIWFRKVTVRK